jgi:hypothetical protein
MTCLYIYIYIYETILGGCARIHKSLHFPESLRFLTSYVQRIFRVKSVTISMCGGVGVCVGVNCVVWCVCRCVSAYFCLHVFVGVSVGVFFSVFVCVSVHIYVCRSRCECVFCGCMRLDMCL